MVCYITYVQNMLYNRTCYITCVMLGYMTYLGLYIYITSVMLYNMCHVMLFNMFHVMLYNTCHVMLFNICHVMLYNTCHVMLNDI